MGRAADGDVAEQRRAFGPLAPSRLGSPFNAPPCFAAILIYFYQALVLPPRGCVSVSEISRACYCSTPQKIRMRSRRRRLLLSYGLIITRQTALLFSLSFLCSHRGAWLLPV